MFRSPRSHAFWLVALLLALPAAAQHQVYLETANSVPSYCQETNIWCGAATGQMTLEGYPGGVEHPFTQTHVWNRIQFHKDDPGVNWATDPDGLNLTLNELGPEGHWVVFANPNAQSLMYSITYWMTRQRYPTPTLVWGFQHWVMIDGIETDVDPTTSSSVNLQFIDIVNPWNPPCATSTAGGIRSFMSGSNWYTNYWPAVETGYPASKWNGNFIAVIEPPKETGEARAPKQPVRGEIISAQQARERAVSYLRELPIKERPYAVLLRNQPLQPLLVNREASGYYLVPFGYEQGQVSQGAVLVNAYDGQFQEVGLFERPISYLSQDDAFQLAVSRLCACAIPRKDVRARLIFQPSEQTDSRLLPVWEFRWGGSVAYVTQDGRVYRRLTKLAPGD